jgi:hypothetical protein
MSLAFPAAAATAPGPTFSAIEHQLDVAPAFDQMVTPTDAEFPIFADAAVLTPSRARIARPNPPGWRWLTARASSPTGAFQPCGRYDLGWRS